VEEKDNQTPHGYGFVTSFVPSMHASGVHDFFRERLTPIWTSEYLTGEELLGSFLGEPSGLVWRNNVNFWLNGLIFQHV
jgi:hypothetical protein